MGLTLLALTPLLTIAAIVGMRWRRRRLLRLGRLPAVVALAASRGQWRGLRNFCLLLGLTGLAIGVAGPQWGREAERITSKGRDLIVVLDLSRSMLADDVQPDPSRIARARKALFQLADAVQRRGGHRLGLVAFATRAELVCPLTHDYDHFRDRVAELDPDSLSNELRPGFHRPNEPEPDDVSGTRMGTGIQAAIDAQDPARAGFQDILLVTDGDDPVDDRDWLAPTRAAANKGMGIYVLGIGDPESGGRIPTADGYYLSKEGRPYYSKLNEKPLEEMARITNGEYIPARTSPPRLDEFFETRIETSPKREVADDALPPYRQRYVWFYGAALLFLIAEMTLGGRRRAGSKSASKDAKRQNGRPSAAAADAKPQALVSSLAGGGVQ